MDQTVDSLVFKLKDAILDSPHLAAMILDRKLDIVWHNPQFGREFQDQQPIVGKKCFRVTGSDTPHRNCPLRASFDCGKHTKGFFDFGDRNFVFVTIPLGDGYAAKIHTYLDKGAEGRVEELSAA
jgi:hypothetical protein